MTFGSVSDRNISAKVADELRDAIQNGRLEPGERLVERKLADSLGVSHIPVREALAKLSEEGLVERTPRRGARVASLTDKELQEITGLRIVLEQYVARSVQQSWTPKSEQTLRRIVRQMVAAAEKEQVESMFALDSRFHETVWELADNRTLLTTVSQLRSRINGFLRAANGSLAADELVAHARSHEALIDALASGDPARAEAAMADHVEIAAHRINAVSHANDADAERAGDPAL